MVFVKSEGCAVCDVLYPKVIKLLKRHNIPGALVAIEDSPEFAGQHSVFTAPAILLFISGKEILRQARFIRIDQIDNEITKWKEFTNK